ncbi:MAG: RNA polymerase subunit sigma-70 [Acidobacteria bacterium]|nr:MAG: RNA polymerase subunit sigma-70 [Acidobacteriota bacterium]
MKPPLPAAVSGILDRVAAGDQKAVSKVMPLVYDELRRLAGRYLRRERGGQTLQPTALVHEAYLRLLKDKKQGWQNRTHFLAIAALSMRQVLVERARARGASKRGGAQVRVTLDETLAVHRETSIDLVALDEALTRLALIDPQQARIVELRFFGGLTVEEAAEALGISPATVKRGWSVARAWLKRELSKGTP